MANLNVDCDIITNLMRKLIDRNRSVLDMHPTGVLYVDEMLATKIVSNYSNPNRFEYNENQDTLLP